MIKKTILIEEKHAKWIEENSINFSKWIRKKIEEEMHEMDKKR